MNKKLIGFAGMLGLAIIVAECGSVSQGSSTPLNSPSDVQAAPEASEAAVPSEVQAAQLQETTA